MHEGPIAAEDDAVHAHLVDEKAQGRLAARDAVVVETTLIGAGGLLNVEACLGAHLPAPVHATHAKAGRPAPVSNAGLERRAGFENPPKMRAATASASSTITPMLLARPYLSVRANSRLSWGWG